ncbi:hypothetical protein [Sinorhizobium chiapasense]|uniref:Uncharacterized protein n=1 Tax=Sinorhizobium chiapasense TaxID=501572 RepID=A0ABZ2BHG1_9HYPH
MRQAILDGKERFLPDPETLPFLKFMFPAIGARVEKLLSSGLASDLDRHVKPYFLDNWLYRRFGQRGMSLDRFSMRSKQARAKVLARFRSRNTPTLNVRKMWAIF